MFSQTFLKLSKSFENILSMFLADIVLIPEIMPSTFNLIVDFKLKNYFKNDLFLVTVAYILCKQKMQSIQ